MAESCSVPSSDRTGLCYWTEELPVPRGDRPNAMGAIPSMPRCAVRMNVHLHLHGAHLLPVGSLARLVHGTDARSSELAPGERASGLASAPHIGHHINQAYPTYCDRQGRSYPPTTMQEAVALAHLRVA